MLALLLLACSDRVERPDLLLVTACSLRADRLGAYGHTRPTSPRFDAFAAEGAVFTRAWANGNWTNSAHASLLTGLYPGRHRVLNDGDVVPADVPLLQEILALYGYRSAAVIEEPGNVSIGGAEGLVRGFGSVDRFDRAEFFTPEPLAERLAAVEGPWFALVHLREAHYDYADGKPFTDTIDPRIEAWKQGHQTPAGRRWTDPNPRFLAELRQDPALQANFDLVYDSGVLEWDTAFGRLLDAFAARGLLDGAVVAVVADHGEELGQHGNLGHKGSLDPDVVHIPLIVRGPGIAARRIADDVSQVDVFATLLDRAGAEPPASLQGRSLVPLLAGATLPPVPVLTQMLFPDQGRLTMRELVTSGSLRLVLDRGQGPVELTREGPGGTWSDVLRAEPVEAARLVAWWEKASAGSSWSSQIPRYPEEVQRAMREKGYW